MEKPCILFLEDDHALNASKTAQFIASGLEVISCHRIDQAIEKFEKYKDKIKCIVTDLNMRSFGLKDYAQDQDIPTLSGWIWLYRYILSDAPNIQVVVFSDFIEDLETRIEKTSDEEEKLAFASSRIRLVKKGDFFQHGHIDICRIVNEILAQPQLGC